MSIDNTQDVIDSRDIIERIAALEDDFDNIDEDELEELTALRALADDLDGEGEWEYGLGLIRESYFTDYVRDLAEDIGAVGRDNASWLVIDWEATARNVSVDYSTVDFDGVDYYYRAS